MFAELFTGYRSSLALVRIHPEPFITFHKVLYYKTSYILFCLISKYTQIKWFPFVNLPRCVTRRKRFDVEISWTHEETRGIIILLFSHRKRNNETDIKWSRPYGTAPRIECWKVHSYGALLFVINILGIFLYWILIKRKQKQNKNQRY